MAQAVFWFAQEVSQLPQLVFDFFAIPKLHRYQYTTFLWVLKLDFSEYSCILFKTAFLFRIQTL